MGIVLLHAGHPPMTGHDLVPLVIGAIAFAAGLIIQSAIERRR